MKRLSLLLLFVTGLCFVSAEEFDAGQYAKRYWIHWKDNAPDIAYPDAPLAEGQRDKLKVYQECVAKFAPHWVGEYLSIDKALGWKPGTYMALCAYGIRKKTAKPSHECTSWIVCPELTGGKLMFLHKNRDATSRRLAILRVASKGKHAWTGMGTPGYFSVNAGINEAGLAVAMNSGSKTDVATREGISTSNIGRILLEECATAGEAVKLLEKIVDERAYYHGDKGSIWFFVDGKDAIIVEQNARHLQAAAVRSGIGIRANSWHYPEMLKHATGSVNDFMCNYLRENVVYKTLVEQCYYSKYIISQQDIWVASRCRSMAGEAIYPPYGRITNSAATLAIDVEYPAELSTAWIACGPPRHTVFMPMPITMTSFPQELLNGVFGDAVFERSDKAGLDASVRKYVQLEQKMLSVYNEALEKARALLKQGNKKSEAAKLLEDAFLANWKYLKENEPFK